MSSRMGLGLGWVVLLAAGCATTPGGIAPIADGGARRDAGGVAVDGGVAGPDGGAEVDGGSRSFDDGGQGADGGQSLDGGQSSDGGPSFDGGQSSDGGTGGDGGATCQTVEITPSALSGGIDCDSAFSQDAVRTQVFTVPRGCFRRSAISLCDRPSIVQR